MSPARRKRRRAIRSSLFISRQLPKRGTQVDVRSTQLTDSLSLSPRLLLPSSSIIPNLDGCNFKEKEKLQHNRQEHKTKGCVKTDGKWIEKTDVEKSFENESQSSRVTEFCIVSDRRLFPQPKAYAVRKRQGTCVGLQCTVGFARISK
ncbi:hypothetical protein OUZ56_013831 [Daphnia magna]|uniref:Uncharacterized protein n=1 Tax=Daphnia magna TaxID=35525 RepID=A0ABQ9Z722_9CRUS|nr:hypothetical protein OUZ56_013831 [Daphnia magna]